MSGFCVDTEALTALAARMNRTRDSVATAASRVRGDATTTGAGLLAGSLSDFEDHWHYGLQKLVDNLDACAHALRDAVTAYERVEQTIERVAGG